MTTITIQIPEGETRLFKELTKKLNWKVLSVNNIPNEETIKAMNELKNGKGIIVKSLDEFLKLVD